MSNAFKRFLLFDELSLFKWFRLCQNFSTLAQIRKQESGVFFPERLKAISCIYIQRSLKITSCIEMTNITFMNVMPVSDYMYVAK